ncbi:MAG: tetratricopeptide repeat protein, partial [Microcystaceae cyanobacterium]
MKLKQDLLSQTKPPVFNLLSIGQRGVGKTVFLAGSYAELQDKSRTNQSESLWFECQDKQDKENLNGILNYVARTGEYPPPTLKITDFNFELKQRSRGREKTLCLFRWWDIPGEYCDFSQPDFQKMVLNSHSCCVFINAYQLVNDANYPSTLERMVKQIASIATLVAPHLLNYRFALIFTQCDRLDSSPISRLQIEQNLQHLIASLEMAKAK